MNKFFNLGPFTSPVNPVSLQKKIFAKWTWEHNPNNYIIAYQSKYTEVLYSWNEYLNDNSKPAYQFKLIDWIDSNPLIYDDKRKKFALLTCNRAYFQDKAIYSENDPNLCYFSGHWEVEPLEIGVFDKSKLIHIIYYSIVE